MQDIKSLQSLVTEFRDKRDWKQFHNPKDMALSLSLESAEVLEHFQWKNNEELSSYLDAHKEAVSEELADVLYWVLLMSNDLEIDISETFVNKMKKNEEKYPLEKAKGNHKKHTEHLT